MVAQGYSSNNCLLLIASWNSVRYHVRALWRSCSNGISQWLHKRNTLISVVNLMFTGQTGCMYSEYLSQYIFHWLPIPLFCIYHRTTGFSLLCYSQRCWYNILQNFKDHPDNILFCEYKMLESNMFSQHFLSPYLLT